MAGSRLKSARLRIWNRDYLANRYLWPDIESAIGTVQSHTTGRASTLLDVGCGHKPYRKLFGADVSYLGMDYAQEESSPDLLGDACSLPIRSGSVDIVFSSQVIEHVPYPQDMLKECARVLKPRGCLILTGPFYWPLHEEPLDFYRFTKYGLSQLLRDAKFAKWEIRENGGDWAQIMLSINLKLTSKLTVPLRCIVNLLGALLDAGMPSVQSPSNYTVIATR